MSSKTLTILAGIFVLLIALVGLQFFAPTAFAPKETPYKTAVKAINAESIDTITITKQNQSVALKQENKIWSIDGKPAAKDTVDQLFTQFINDPVAQEIAQTNTRHTELEVTDDLATNIQFSDKLTLLAGKSVGDSLYVRAKGNDAVYLLTNASPSTISTDVIYWQDKTIIKVEESALTKLSFLIGQEHVSLVKENGAWKLEEGKREIDPAAISSLLNELRSFQAKSLADLNTAAPFMKSSAIGQITIEHAGGKEVLEFVKGDASEYLVTRQSDKMQFIVPEFQAKHFLINQQDILKKDPSETSNPS